MKPYETIPVKFAHKLKGDDIHSECTTMIEIVDYGAGASVMITQPTVQLAHPGHKGGILVSSDEWASLSQAIKNVLDIADGLNENDIPVLKPEAIKPVQLTVAQQLSDEPSPF